MYNKGEDFSKHVLYMLISLTYQVSPGWLTEFLRLFKNRTGQIQSTPDIFCNFLCIYFPYKIGIYHHAYTT